MATVYLHTAGGVRQLWAEEGVLLSQVLSDPGYAPDMPCGGVGRCGKCRVRAEGALSAHSGEEEKCLSEEDRRQGIRLACCTCVLGDAHVWLISDVVSGQICVTGIQQQVLQDAMFTKIGAAIDIGTTTLAAQLYDDSGLIATASAHNPQRIYGADVISRVEKALKGEAAALQNCICQGIGQLLTDLCRQAGRTLQELDGIVITGNTAMLCLFTGQDVSALAAAPFSISEYFGKTVCASALGLPCLPDTPVYLPRCISAFVGADITTALMASGICEKGKTALLADIGTNGELALWHDGMLSCCSTAAGPAFEGANLSCGMQGVDGAVDHVWVEQDALAYHTIGDSPARGICGSGVADLLACLLQLQQLDSSGFLEEGEVSLGDACVFDQGDVRQVQLAKSAVRSGMEALLHHKGISYQQVDEVSIAGGFGSYLSLESAAAIGLIPPELRVRCKSIGNAALSGASMLLRNKRLQAQSAELAAAARTVDLASDLFFMEQYVEQMMF